MSTEQAEVGHQLLGRVARLARSTGGRLERVLVSHVVDEDGVVLIIGDLLYASRAYGDRDSRGMFSTMRYAAGELVDVEAEVQS